MRRLHTALLACALLAPVRAASAQALPAGPAELANGTVAVSGDVSVSVGSHDDVAFFNYTDYEHNALRLVRADVSGIWRPAPRLAVLTAIRSEDGERPVAYALYLRVRPWLRHAFDIQAGRIPPVFGAFARRSYGVNDNPLIGYPLAYQYLTSLRPDAVPATADDLLAMRARGWRATYPVGNVTSAPGVPLVSAYRWDTGAEAHAVGHGLDAAVAVTTGTLSVPKVTGNGSVEVSARVGATPMTGLVFGVSFARGAFLDRSLVRAYAPIIADKPYTQIAVGADAEYSRDHWIVRGEMVHSRWDLPRVSVPAIASPVSATSAYVETRYRVSPRWYGAFRADMLTFSRITGARLFDGLPTTWDAPVQRLEAGAGYYLQRNLVLRASVQPNWRDGGRIRRRTFLSAQVSYWF